VLALCTVVAGVLPAFIAYLGQLIVDAVVLAQTSKVAISFQEPLIQTTLKWVGLEALVVIIAAGNQRIINTCQSLLRAMLGQRVNEMILVKAQTLSLDQFEDSEFYDKLTRARREASTRPLGLVNKTFNLIQQTIALFSFGVILWQFSVLAIVLLFVASLPVFIAETKFSGDAFRLFRWRSPDYRKQMYLETLLAREDSAKEVKLFGLSDILLNRYRDIFKKIFGEDKALTLRREKWGFWLGVIGSAAFYFTYCWIAVATIGGELTLGEMTMYLLVFKQGQTAISTSLTAISGMYEDNLYLSNLFEYLEQPVVKNVGQVTSGQKQGTGIVFDNVSFTYPGSHQSALKNISFSIKPGQQLAIVGENGSGKTTLIKLLTRLYQPSAGKILIDGTALEHWQTEALQNRFSLIFQDFMRYQFSAGENLGVGNIEVFNDDVAWESAGKKGLAHDFISDLSDGYQTQLGKWFKDGQELSGGQWQKVALSRLFMRTEADILVLDEPTAAVDARAEAELFELFKQHTAGKMSILISHRFANVRKAEMILVLEHGEIIEQGTHQELINKAGTYAQLYDLQAAGFVDS
jgi:ABC-type multidrug transport system fused ATPase/permease subunit